MSETQCITFSFVHRQNVLINIFKLSRSDSVTKSKRSWKYYILNYPNLSLNNSYYFSHIVLFFQIIMHLCYIHLLKLFMSPYINLIIQNIINQNNM